MKLLTTLFPFFYILNASSMIYNTWSLLSAGSNGAPGIMVFFAILSTAATIYCTPLMIQYIKTFIKVFFTKTQVSTNGQNSKNT